MKKIGEYFGLISLALVAGICLGFLFFGNKKNHTNTSTNQTQSKKDEIWTCAMHPQIRQPEFGICPLCNMDLTPLDESASSDKMVLEMTPEAIALSNIETVRVGSTNGTKKTIELTGKIQADERNSSSLVAHIPGRIEKLFVTFTGEKIKVNDRLATIYSQDLIDAQRELLEAIKLSEFNPNLVEAAKQKMRYWKISDRFIEQIETTGKIQETFTLFAEHEGVVMNRRVAVGDYVKTGEALFEVMDLNKLWVLFDAYEEQLPAIRIGQRITYTTPAIPNKKLQAKITYIDPLINPKTRVASIRAEATNTNGKLKPEMFVTGILESKRQSANSQITIPKTAVLWTGKASVVYLKVPDTEIPSFKYKVVELGESVGDQYVIKSGLTLEDEIVVNGAFVIDASAQLNNQNSMMNKLVNQEEESIIDRSNTNDFSKKMTSTFKNEWNVLLDDYLALKNGLVQTNGKIAKAKSQLFLSHLKTINSKSFDPELAGFWNKKSKALEQHLNKLIKIPSDVEEMRIQFNHISELILDMSSALGSGSQNLYVQYCPMAFDDQGAYWVSNERGIKNPYFGDKMMKCGLVKDSLIYKK